MAAAMDSCKPFTLLRPTALSRARSRGHLQVSDILRNIALIWQRLFTLFCMQPLRRSNSDCYDHLLVSSLVRTPHFY